MDQAYYYFISRSRVIYALSYEQHFVTTLHAKAKNFRK